MGRSRTVVRPSFAFALPFALALSLRAGASRAEAPPTEAATEARARALYDEASQLLAEARVEEACRKLAESEALDPDVKTLQRLATCEEAEGKLARALAAYHQLTLLAGRSLRGARERAVLARVQRLEASVPRLIVRLSPEALGTADLEVRACGVVLREGELGLPIAEDPGTCEVSARAAGKAPWAKSVDLGARGGRTEVVVPALEAEAPAPLAEAAPAPPPAPPPEPPPPAPPTGPATERRVTGVALAGVGLALAGAGAYFGVAAMGSSHDADARCPTTTCADPEGLHLNDRALTQASLANLSLGAGAIAFVTGIAILLTQPSRPAAGRSAVQAWLRPAPAPHGLGLGGVF